MPLFDAPQYALQTSNTPNVTNTQLLFFKRTPYSRAAVLTMEKVFLRARGIPPLELRRYFPFANADVAFQLRQDAYLPACDKRMPLPCDDDLHQHTTYRNSLSLLLSYQTYPKAARLASLLPPSPLHTPPASAAPLTRKLPTVCLVPRRPPEKETLVWQLLAFVLRYELFHLTEPMYILCNVSFNLLQAFSLLIPKTALL